MKTKNLKLGALIVCLMLSVVTFVACNDDDDDNNCNNCTTSIIEQNRVVSNGLLEVYHNDETDSDEYMIYKQEYGNFQFFYLICNTNNTIKSMLKDTNQVLVNASGVLREPHEDFSFIPEDMYYDFEVTSIEKAK